MTFQNADDVNFADDVAGLSVMMNNPNARQKICSQGNSTRILNNNNNNRPSSSSSSSYHHHHHQRRTKRSNNNNNNSITTLNIIKRATKNKTKICLVALIVFISFVNLMVFSRDSEARLMSSGRKYAAKTVLKKKSNRKKYQTKKTTKTLVKRKMVERTIMTIQTKNRA